LEKSICPSGGRPKNSTLAAVDFWQNAKGKYLMSSAKFFWNPEHWRFRAEEARTVADQMTHEEARTIVRRIAKRLRPSR
jgi:hypothetical protein